MRTRKIIPIRNFPHKLFSVIAVFTFIAFLLTLKPVAEVVKKGAEMVGINFPPMDIFRNVAGNMLIFGIATMAALFAGVIAVPAIKLLVTAAAVVVVAVTLYNIYKSFTGKTTQKILPEGKLPNVSTGK